MKFEGSWSGVGVSTVINADGSTSKINQNVTYEITNLGDNAYLIYLYNFTFLDDFFNEIILGGYVDKRTNTLIIGDYPFPYNFIINDNVIYMSDKEIYNSFNLNNGQNIYIVNLKLTRNCIVPPKNKRYVIPPP
jgi:hypothetical protein